MLPRVLHTLHMHRGATGSGMDRVLVLSGMIGSVVGESICGGAGVVMVAIAHKWLNSIGVPAADEE